MGASFITLSQGINKRIKMGRVMHKREIVSLEDLKRFLRKFFRNEAVEVYLFGSRARGNASEFSDVDIAVFSEKDISDKLALLMEILEESNLPFKIDLVDLKKAPYLKEVVKREGKRWI
jgi:predicted nucleotidyltransferase